MAKQDLKEPEEMKEPEVQVLADKEEDLKPIPTAEKKKVLKKFTKYAKGK